MLFTMSVIYSIGILWVAYQNLMLIEEKDRIMEELQQSREDLSKLKLLNKLKVDCDGNPIRYEDIIE